MFLKTMLSKDEKIIKVVKLHFFAFLFPVFFLLLGFAMIHGRFPVVPIIGIIIIVLAAKELIIKACIEMVVTTKRVIIKKGFLSATTDELKLEKIESVSFNKPLFGMIFNYGSLFFSGTGTTKVKFIFVSNPIVAKKTIEDTIEEYQKKLLQKN